MTKHLKRHLSILLAALIVMSVLATFPLTAGAIADTSDPWIFEIDGTTVYDLGGKWVRYDGEDFQLNGKGVFTLDKTTSSRNCTLYYGGVAVAKRNTYENLRVAGSTMYVTGIGSVDNPYVFTPNIVYGKSDGTFGSVTVFVGQENFPTRTNDNNNNNDESFDYVAVPGDGFTDASRMWVGAENYVRFVDQSNGIYQPNPGNQHAGYFGVRKYNSGIDYGMYNGNAQFTNNTTHFTFKQGNDILYYLGRESYGDNNLYTFAESVDKKVDFAGTNKVLYTVTWEDQDGFVFKKATYSPGEIAVTPEELDVGGEKAPSKESDAYSYTFTGFEPAYELLTDDMTYVATYEATPVGSLSYSVESRIFSTNDGRGYNEEDDPIGMCYSYNGSEPTAFTEGGSFSVDDGHLLLGSVIVADIDTSNTAYKMFSNTVYVTGSGEQDDPLIFHPNYIYGDASKVNVKDGATVAIDSTHIGSGDKGTANPGDGFRAMSRIRVGSDDILFLQKNGTFKASRNYLGVGETTYGYRYNKVKALPFIFVSEDHILYYFEPNTSGQYQFSETEPPLRTTFKPTSSTIHTVTWKNYDNTVLDTETYYVGTTPTYKGATPVKEPSDGKEYTFSDWTPAVSPVTGDVEYTATFTEADRTLFKGYTLTLNGDIGLNFWLNVSEDEVTQAEGTTVEFEWNVKGHTEPKTANAKLTAAAGGYKIVDGHKYYKATCWVAAAEMAYDIHATAYINGEKQSETNTYSVKRYGMDVLNSPDGTFDKQALLTDLVKKMLDYGAKAQTLFDRADVPLANSGLVDNLAYTMSQTDNDKSINENITYTRSDMRDGTEESLGLKYLGTSIIYLSKTSLRHYYQVVDKDLFNNVKDFVGGGFVYGVNGDAIYFEKQDIAAADIDAIQTFTIGGKSFNFSVLDYIKLVLNSDLSDNDKKLAMATYWYNKAADAYFTP